MNDHDPMVRIWNILIDTAHKRTTIHYRSLLYKAGLASFDVPYLYPLLTVIGDAEEKNDRPWINGLVVTNAKNPGPGFFIWCKKYIARPHHDIIALPQFYEDIKEMCYDYWGDDNNYEKFLNGEIVFSV